MKPKTSFAAIIRRSAGFFPTPAVAVGTGGGNLKPDAFSVISVEPAIVGFTFAKPGPVLSGKSVRITALGADQTAAPPATLECTLIEAREIGDHVLLLAAVQRVCLRPGYPLVNWRRASFSLAIEHPFLKSSEALESFVIDWTTGVLPKAVWTHGAHVAVTGFHAFDNSAENVFAAMKQGILHFNSCTGVMNGPDSGYHETLTRFWSNTITRCISDAQPHSRFDAAAYAVRLFGEDRDLPALFYSFDVVRDRRARKEWVPPDQEPLPDSWGAN